MSKTDTLGRYALFVSRTKEVSLSRRDQGSRPYHTTCCCCGRSLDALRVSVAPGVEPTEETCRVSCGSATHPSFSRVNCTLGQVLPVKEATTLQLVVPVVRWQVPTVLHSRERPRQMQNLPHTPGFWARWEEKVNLSLIQKFSVSCLPRKWAKSINTNSYWEFPENQKINLPGGKYYLSSLKWHLDSCLMITVILI